MSNLLLTVASFATSILLFVIFFSKKLANNKETKIYSTLLKNKFSILHRWFCSNNVNRIYSKIIIPGNSI